MISELNPMQTWFVIISLTGFVLWLALRVNK